jgi:hypothetical protein
MKPILTQTLNLEMQLILPLLTYMLNPLNNPLPTLCLSSGTLLVTLSTYIAELYFVCHWESPFWPDSQTRRYKS